MMAAAEAQATLVSFCDLEGQVWGAAFDGAVVVAFGDRRIAGGPETTTLQTGTDEWKLAGPHGLDLSIAPVPAAEANGPAELCRVHGHAVLDGDRRAVDCRGLRSSGPFPGASKLDSLRGVWGWFDEAQAVAVIAARPAGAAGQETDVVAASLFDAEGPITVQEPRLSTTYGAEGLPERVGLELWIGDGEEQYPRRAAGEALDPGEGLTAGTTGLRILPLRCHSAGLDGPGVYLLARF
jgi:hypothetical protein